MSHVVTHSPAPSPPSPAVEVVATLGTSVVGVAHVSDPKSGALKPATRAMLIGGTVALAIGALAFLAATRIAAANHSNLTAWLASGKPGWSFRPEMVPGWVGVMSFLGFSLGLTAVVAGLSRRRRELEPSTIAIGTAAGVDFAVGGTTSPRQALVAPQGDVFVLDLTGMTGEITSADGTPPVAIAPMATALTVTQGMRVRAALGPVAFHITAVEPARRQTTPLAAMLDRRALAFVAASAAAHLGLWAVARATPPVADSSMVSVFSEEELSTRLINIEHEDPNPEEPDPADAGEVSSSDGTAAMVLEQGTIGDVHQSSTDPAKRKIKDREIDPQLARQEALEQATSAGLFGSAAIREGDVFGSIVGTGMVSSGFDDAMITGAINGDGEGAPYGFGQNASGNGFGGGGTSFRVGGYNTIRDGSRTGEGWGIPGAHACKSTTGVCRPHKSEPPVVLSKPTILGGDYDASIIRRYVKRKLDAIGYCYEKELIANPDLEGTVMAEWTINMAGRVDSPSAHGVDAKVASCIAGVVGSIQFPKPPQVGVYQVRYPFVLHKHAQ